MLLRARKRGGGSESSLARNGSLFLWPPPPRRRAFSSGAPPRVPLSFVSRFLMQVEGGAFGFDMANDVELTIGELTPIEVSADTVSETPTP